MELAADESVILAYWQLQDAVDDLAWLQGVKYRTAMGILGPAYKKAKRWRPAFDEAARNQIEGLHQLEKARSSSMDAAADAFAILLAAAADELPDGPKRRVLFQLLYHLGRWVYLIDAADDIKKDFAGGSYNPLIPRYGLLDGNWTKESRHAFALTLDHSIHMMATAFELGDFGIWTPILSKTLYNTLPAVGKSVLDGTFHHLRRKRIHTIENNEG